ncbi:MAG: hypothetical protein KJO07_05245 [Deltaproteobacteria bacterium]|nr:hypothetical protein [Deltaproteobacteria bacterium]
MSRAARSSLLLATGLVLALCAALGLATSSCAFDIDSGQVECSQFGDCPPGFQCRFDGLCYREGIGLSSSCGNGQVELNETCDPRESCPDDCEDSNACTIDVRVGAEQDCNVACLRTVIDECADNDGCCPAGCAPNSDSDCSQTCGNDEIDVGETCDPPGSCPQDCDDGNDCTEDLRTGSAANCNVVCTSNAINACIDDDGCCPGPCDANSDSDCSSTCGNEKIEPGETCDPPDTCPRVEDCDDDLDCTNDFRIGSRINCNARCVNDPISQCDDGDDGCCPNPGCFGIDPDCDASGGDCNNDMVCDFPDEQPETCPDDCFGCGDGYCDDNFSGGGTAAENAINCPEDCLTSNPCGDGYCNILNENIENCPADCSCDDGVCDEVESKDPASCPEDCEDVPFPPG